MKQMLLLIQEAINHESQTRGLNVALEDVI